VRYRWQRRLRRDVANVDVTAFLSLMVILVPFLLITAVFSRLTILELQGPGRQGATTPSARPPSLEIIVRESFIDVYQGDRGRIARIENNEMGYDLAALGGVLRQVKAKSPSMTEANILFEPQVAYDVVVQVMDTARVRVDNRTAPARIVDLFPVIALGEAPLGDRRREPGR
jgi:biopolymer transport protein ExbD